jgi:methylmalonyl-CoA mutase, C-terminal domain
MSQPIRVLIAKAGLDGHDRGALVIAQGLRDQGMEVIYTGLRQTPEQIVTTAIQEDVACIGLSSLSGAHLELFPEVIRLLKEQQADDILVIGGGVIPESDVAILEAEGVAKVFTPGTTIAEVAEFIRANVHLRALDESALAASPARTIDHVGVAVKSIAEVLPFYTRQLGLSVTHEEVVADQGVRVVFVSAANANIELLEPVDETGAMAKFIAKHGPGVHHVAYAVDDIHQAIAQAKAAGMRVLDESPRRGAHGKWVAFLHPKDTFGVLTEFCQQPQAGDRE